MTVSIGNVPVTILIDSGSTCNIINTEYKKLIDQGAKLFSCSSSEAQSSAISSAREGREEDRKTGSSRHNRESVRPDRVGIDNCDATKAKADEIRLCVDMREANKAILRTRHVNKRP